VDGVLHRHKAFPAVINPILDLIDTLTNECLQAFETYYHSSSNTLESNCSAPIENLYTQLELLIDVNQSLLTGGLGVGHRTLDTVCRITSGFGLHSKLTGAGGGGCAITLIHNDTSDSTVAEVKQELAAEGFECWEASIGVPGVFVHTDEKGKL